MVYEIRKKRSAKAKFDSIGFNQWFGQRTKKGPSARFQEKRGKLLQRGGEKIKKKQKKGKVEPVVGHRPRNEKKRWRGVAGPTKKKIQEKLQREEQGRPQAKKKSHQRKWNKNG